MKTKTQSEDTTKVVTEDNKVKPESEPIKVKVETEVQL